MTDSICHSSLRRAVIETVALTSIEFCINPRKKSRPCVYISTPLNRYQPKSSAICACSMVQVSI